jgi:redox-sensitive bicupin YhaK (pirin superfamily)
MSIKITKQQNQAQGSFAGGAILENKPIGFPQDGGEQKPFSNLFYWANAWSDNGGLIGEHPHKMFEIMSFVIDGELEHYDNKFDRWLPLAKGDAQIIRSGSGISHAEKILGGGRMFQIWFDPNIQKTMSQPATYDDYKSDEMHYFEENGISTKNYIGSGGPIKMDSEGVEINEFTFPEGKHQMNLKADKIYTYYMLSGKGALNDENLSEHDFIIIEDETSVEITVESETRLFSIAIQNQLSYKTYIELVNN